MAASRRACAGQGSSMSCRNGWQRRQRVRRCVVPNQSARVATRDHPREVQSLREECAEPDQREYPHLSRVVREREALEARYEALRVRDSRDGKQRQSKGKADACTQEREGTFVRMTVAMTGYVFCTGLYVAGESDVAASAAERMPEVEINARRESLSHLRAEIVRLEDNFYSKYNQLNADKQYDIQCSREAPTGSILRRRNCLPVFVNRATEDEARRCFGVIRRRPRAVSSCASGPTSRRRWWRRFRHTRSLQKLSAEHAAMQKHYAMVRKLKFKGRIFVLD